MSRYGTGSDYHLVTMADDRYEDLQQNIGVILGDLLKTVKNDKIKLLEIGTGSGMTLKEIAGSDERLEITTIDNDRGMLEEAKSVMGRQNNIDYVEADALDYLQKAPDNHFDIVVTACTLHNWSFEYQEAVLKQVLRILKNHGLFLNADKIASDDIAKHQAAYNKEFNNLSVFKSIGKPELTEMWKKHYAEDDSRRITESEYKEKLRKLGFTNVEMHGRYSLNIITTAENNHAPERQTHWTDHMSLYDTYQLKNPKYLKMLDFHVSSMKGHGLILDSGAGTGNLSLQLAQKGHKVIAIDSNIFSLTKLKEKCSGLNAKTKVVDLEKEIPFEDNYFDGVCSSFVIPFVENYMVYLSEIHRVLKPNGVFSLSVALPIKGMMDYILNNIKRDEKEFVRDNPDLWERINSTSYKNEKHIMDKGKTEGETLNLMRKIGFREIKRSEDKPYDKFVLMVTCKK